MEKIRITLKDNVAETLLIPLWMRAEESKRSDALFHDEISCKLVNSIDYDFSKFDKDKHSQNGVAIRTAYLDHIVEEYIKRENAPIIILIGCGLDPRVQRIKNNYKAIFYELDLPEVIELRRKILPEAKNEKYLSGSAFSTEWIEFLRKRHPQDNFLFICEGLFMYFEETLVMQCVQNLSHFFPCSNLYFERISTLMCKNSNKQKSVSNTKALFKWGVDDPCTIEKWSSNIKSISTFYYLDKRLKRWGIMGFIMRIIPVLRHSFGIWGFYFTPNN